MARSGTKKQSAQSISEKTHISLRTACAVVLVAVVPLTWFVASLSYGQEKMNIKIDTTIKELHETMIASKEANDKQVERSDAKIADHEVRIRILEKDSMGRKP